MAVGFNEDVTTEILLLLPVKSILRFKTVSKQWLSIVSCRRFRQIHASRIGSNLPTATGLFIQPQNHEVEFLPLKKPDNQISLNNIPFSDYPISIISSSSGLLLLRSMPTTGHQRFKLIDGLPYPIVSGLDGDPVYFVCNPTTKEFKPLVIPQHKEFTVCSETLAFDPSKSPHYKVVFLCYFLCNYHEMGLKFEIEIYSSETATFSSPVTNSITAPIGLSFSPVVYCNDAIHWFSYSTIYYFDLNRECINVSPLPPHSVGRKQHFDVSRGRLLLVSVDSNCYPEFLINVYEPKSDYSGWSLKYEVDLDFVALACPQDVGLAICKQHYSVLSILVDEEEGLTLVLLVCGMFVACNFKKKLCNLLRLYDRFQKFGWPIAHQYIQTLACV